MMNTQLHTQAPSKVDDAKRLLTGCIGKAGVWASPARYRGQCWTRDFCLALAPALASMGRYDAIEHHFDALCARQDVFGSIPILYLEDELQFLMGKLWNSLKSGRMSFMLRAYFSKKGIGQVTPWTTDSELQFAFGMANYGQTPQGKQFVNMRMDEVMQALACVHVRHMKGGLMYGVDWRDTLTQLATQPLLTNNCLLYRTYTLLGLSEKAADLKAAIQRDFWTGTYFRDYPGVEHFDTLGNAFAILYGLADVEQTASILASAAQLQTPYGYKLNGVWLPPKNATEAELMKRIEQNGVIWPFIHGFMILAALKAGCVTLAKQEFGKWSKLEGFWEYYSPETGQGHGSPEQSWSAALYLRVWDELQKLETRSPIVS